MKRYMYFVLATVLTLALLAACAPAPKGEDAAEFYKQNKVTLIVPYSPGGGMDTVARLIAEYWPSVSGGQMVVENKEGAGGLIGTNYVARANADGLTIGTGGEGIVLSPFLGTPGVEYESRKLGYIAAIAPGAPIVFSVGSKSPLESWEDVKRAKQITISGLGRDQVAVMLTALVWDMMGLGNLNLVVGYKSANDAIMAAAKGETDGITLEGLSTHDEMKKGFLHKPFVSFSLEKNPVFPDVPLFSEVEKLTRSQEKLYEVVITSLSSLQGYRLFYAPEAVPEDRLQFLRDAFYTIATDKNFIEKLIQLNPTRWAVWLGEPLKGDVLANMVERNIDDYLEYIPELTRIVDKYTMAK